MAYGRLDVFWPDGKLESFSLEADSISVGRSSGNTITLDTDTISRYHFSITYEEGKVFITDLDSANGTFVDGGRLESNKPHYLEGVEEIQIGHLRMLFHPVDDSPTLPMSAISEDTQRVEKESPDFRIDVTAPEIAVSPAAYTSAELKITNLAEEAKRFSIEVSGMPDGWIRANRPEVNLNPHESTQVLFNIKPPRRSDSAPGVYKVKISVRAKDNPNHLLEAEIDVTILAFGGFGMALKPRHIDGDTSFHLHLHNQGSADLPLRLWAQDKNHRLKFDLPAAAITLAPGQRLQIRGAVQPRKPLLFGSPREHAFALFVHSQTPAAFTAGIDGYFVEKPRFSNWLAMSAGGVAVSLVLALLMLLPVIFRAPPPTPNISLFEVNTTQIAQGEALALSWQATDVASFNVSVNGTPVISQIDANVPGITLDTSGFSGEILLALEGVNGETSDRETRTIRVYQPAFVEYFTVEPASLVRGVVQPLTLRWHAPGAKYTRITGMESFTAAALQPAYAAQDSIVNIAGYANDTFIITLFAEDEIGNTLQQPVTVNVINAECTPAQQDIALHEGPHLLHQVVSTVPLGVNIVVEAQDETGQWLRASLPGGAFAWGLRSQFACSSTFLPENLRRELNVPLPPTLTPTATPTPTLTPSATPTVVPSNTFRPPLLPRTPTTTP